MLERFTESTTIMQTLFFPSSLNISDHDVHGDIVGFGFEMVEELEIVAEGYESMIGMGVEVAVIEAAAVAETMTFGVVIE